MPTVHVVELPVGKTPTLPRVCVVCGKAGIEALETMQLSDEAGRVDFYLYGLSRKPAQGRLLAVGVHDACARRLRNASLRRLLAILLAWVALGAAGIALGFDAMLVFAIATVAAMPLLQLEFARPMPLEFWFSGHRCCLAFRDSRLAANVARLNDAEVEQREAPGSLFPRSTRGTQRSGRTG